MAGALTTEDWQNDYCIYDNLFQPYVDDICEVIDITSVKFLIMTNDYSFILGL